MSPSWAWIPAKNKFKIKKYKPNVTFVGIGPCRDRKVKNENLKFKQKI